MATNIDTGLSIQDAVNADHSPHIFTMSNGDLVAIYYDGTNFVWRSKPSGGSWGSSNTITLDTGVTPPQVSYLTRNGDAIFAIVSRDPIDASHNADFFQFAYTTSTHTLSTSHKQIDNADGNEKAAGIGYTSGGSANNQVLALHGNAAGSFATVQQLNVNPGIFGTDQVPTMMDYRTSALTGLVTDGTSTTYLIYAIASTGTAFKVERFLTSSAADNVESPSAPAAALKGVTAVYDGTNYVFIANENNAKLRYLTRTGTNTYGAWTDILSDASLVGQPAVCVKSGGDLAVFYRTNKNQANGEIWVVERTSGTWGSPSLLAGGASTGWSNPSCAASDLNDTGVARVVYVTGTASTWTLVEDSYTFGGGTVTNTRTVPTSIAAQATATRTVPASIATQATAARTVSASIAAQVTSTRSVPASIAVQTTQARTVPTSIAAQVTSARTVSTSIAVQTSALTRTVPASLAALVTSVRTVPATIATLTTNARNIPASIATQTTNARTVSASIAVQTTQARTAPASIATQVTSARTVPATIAVSEAGVASRTVPTSIAAQTTATRSIPASIAVLLTGILRTVPASIAVSTPGVTVPGSVSLSDAAVGSASVSDALVDGATIADAAVGVLTLTDA